MTSPSPKRDDAVTPLQREFDHVWNGFDRSQVREYIANLETTLERLIEDRDSARAQVSSLTEQLDSLRSENGQLQARVEELLVPPENLEDLDERMQRVGHLAYLQAEEITTRAQTAAEERWKETAQASIDLRERYRSLLKELDSQAQQLHAQHRAALEETRVEVQKLTTDAVRRREQLDAEEERKRRSIEQEFDASMAAQRSALEKYIADQQTASKNQAERRLSDAAEEARKRIADAQAEADRRIAEANSVLERLAALRNHASDKLAGADQILADSEAAIEPLDEEQLPVPRAEDDDEALGVSATEGGSARAESASAPDGHEQPAAGQDADGGTDDALPKRTPKQQTPPRQTTVSARSGDEGASAQ
ncbi:DivIVA domain-containing protein [Haloechinothrix sp. YIM 98757]|uniref:DivIVA domain-containing protein n=1 Tax=Haloechinothrix aidingensis TaxID=2752311 RepID=A0A838A949_9PSEU|nr:DivIVA domain-containing protein [Haloechinothrix aidingensis]MBA0125437.1 DivIVA domain-containing protein [Haloechinothrix aidingensis]